MASAANRGPRTQTVLIAAVLSGSELLGITRLYAPEDPLVRHGDPARARTTVLARPDRKLRGCNHPQASENQGVNSRPALRGQFSTGLDSSRVNSGVFSPTALRMTRAVLRGRANRTLATQLRPHRGEASRKSAVFFSQPFAPLTQIALQFATFRKSAGRFVLVETAGIDPRPRSRERWRLRA